ncbi:MAG: monofunctional biosynthetic peptidoglycan transglycosylase [Bacteroidetes bacterium 24-39-8]|jgi:monofunctional biosynthetic peptidoglycan transglycosylase|nr:MAG: monofunctional biosynthetic peptidoglycan transglycosylase [Sphingobacteriia bacterium 35-40-8]OYZ51577.1 MAG: monofunctional biosynthetic peptidoglycan transglycosylase [Bacteroidetes bacterium 24-39-8]OZA62960.1 MAG: monofunctional biosynthetic peptidoglycan transglycosylase [Sphingobacteriia bacterium 39-39-8]HQR94460.1 monofunctional biosynthetic peptidoglycan transglycosylase [Sediminibacterium sp.]HQS55579.1 monofunctional biosynthetic peptidoglycan transglycosylase [Sediminibacte
MLKKIWRFTKKAMLWMFVSSLLYVIICKWVMPPVTITQISNAFGYGLKRDYVSGSQLSYNAKLAAIASEDQAFPDHTGFDWDAIEKSLKPKKKGKKRKLPLGAGTSTITQQVAKNVFLWQGGGVFKYIRKVPEAYFTLLIELIWGKERILDVYLNVIETGPGIFGMEAAAQAYFGKPAKQLSRAEAAMIIACLPNPKIFTVKPQSRRVGWRYPQILREMHNIEDDPDVLDIIKSH